MPLLTKIIYGILFLLLLLHPHFITGHIFGLPPAYVQSLATLLIMGIGLAIYLRHQSEIKKKDEEKKTVEDKLQFSGDRLNDAFKYIGQVNRQLPLLNNITTDLIKLPQQGKRAKEMIIKNLLATATVSLARADWGLFRFIEIANERTCREFVYATKNFFRLKPEVGNKELCQSRAGLAARLVEIGGLYALSTSDDKAWTQCFFIFPKGANNVAAGIATLQAVVDQAQLFHQYLYESL